MHVLMELRLQGENVEKHKHLYRDTKYQFTNSSFKSTPASAVCQCQVFSSDECSSFFIAWDPPEYGSCIFKCSKQSLGRLKWSQPEFSNKKMETFST